MNKIKLFLMTILVFSFISGCNVLDKEDEFDGITVETFTTVDDLGKNYGLYYGFVIKNQQIEASNISIEFTPKDEELKKLVGTRSVSQSNGVSQNTSFVTHPGIDISIGQTVLIPKKKFTKEELEKKIKDFSFSINNGKYKKIYE